MTQDNSPLADIAGDIVNIYRGLERLYDSDNYDSTDENSPHQALGRVTDKAAAFDQLLSDIRAGVVKIVPCEWPEDKWQELNYALSLPAPANQYKFAVKAAPAYEPIEKWVG